MRELLLAVLVYGTVVAQTSVCPHVAVAGASPDAFVWVLAFAGLLGRARHTFLPGALLGLTRDLAGTGLLGPYTVAYCVCGYVLGRLRATLDREGIVVHMIVVAGVCLVGHVLAGTAAIAVGQADVGFGGLVCGAAGTALYTAVLTPAVFPAFRRLNRVLGVLAPLRRE